MRVFTRIAVVNRGEPAMRLIRAVRELNAEFDLGLTVIALHTEAERKALFVRASDEAVRLRDAGVHGNPYLDHAELERALRAAKADAAWVGWGFVAEDPAFAELCARLAVKFIGPSPDAMRRLGDKIEAKLLAESAGMPVAAWSRGAVETIDDARRHADVIGYPLVIKARSGGGGRGIRVVRVSDELGAALERTKDEALSTFADPIVFMEKLVEGGRHIEVQVIADNYGNVWAPGVRDCSIQRRNQKVIEESSSPVLSAAQEAGLRAAAIALVHEVGYQGAGTVEFLYQPRDETFAFLEVNTRLQVEHPVTEAATGLDLVKLQILLAAGHKLDGDAPPTFGHAVEARLNAEDADAGFAPAPGVVEMVRFPSGPGIRVDAGIAAGDVIRPEYDSMVAKIIAWGQNRTEAFARLRCALRDTAVAVQGGTTTKSFLLALLDDQEVLSGAADTGWLDRVNASPGNELPRHADIALLAVAVQSYEAEEALERESFFRSARGGRPRASHTPGRNVELGYLGRNYSLTVAQISPSRHLVTIDGAVVDVEVERLSRFESRVTVADRDHEVMTVPGPAFYRVEVDCVSHRVTRDEGGVVRSPAPAVVVAVRVDAGAEVAAGDTVVVLESMKMETQVRTPHAGRVRQVMASVNSQVDAGAALLLIDRIADGGPAVTAPAVSFESSSITLRSDLDAASLRQLSLLHSSVTGYDIDAQRIGALLADYELSRARIASGDPQLVRAELTLLTTFADVCELSRNRPSDDQELNDERVHSPREYFHTYLASLDVEREALPEAFRHRLTRALRHYDVHDLEPGPELEDAVYRLFLAQEQASDHVPVVAALLEYWLSAADTLTGQLRDDVGELLDRLVAATQLRFPVLGNLARTVRFQLFDRPFIDATRERVYEGIREHLRYLAATPHAADYAERIAALVAAPEQLSPVLAEVLSHRDPALTPMLEAMTRRYYKMRTLANVATDSVDGRPVLTGEFELQGKLLHLIATVIDMADPGDLDAALVWAASTAQGVAEPANVVTDLYLSWPNRPADPDNVSAHLREVLGTHPELARGRRITVIVCIPGQAEVARFTFRPTKADGFAEERIIRDMHPLTGQRLDLWRLKNFHGTRLPAPPGVYLFHCVAPENPSDERLVALAEVRDVTPARDPSGRPTGFPAAERVLAACLDGIRRVQAGRGRAGRLDANQIFLHVWPTIELPIRHIIEFGRTTAPQSVGAGLEEITVLATVREQPGQHPRDIALRFGNAPGAGFSVSVTDPPTDPVLPRDAYAQKVQRSAARGLMYPYEIVPLLTGPDGSFIEYDFDSDGRFSPVDRAPGRNTAGIVTGVISAPTDQHPEGMNRVVLFGDPTKALGTVAVPECALVVAALDLAEARELPVEWFALSSGATISMDSGTENMDAVARGLRRLITFTQGGGEVNIIVAGINVGAQPYWNAEATMLLHTKGILVMTPDSAMVLTGKNSLDYSGGVSAEDNFGIGGYDRVMGPNGQAQYWAPNLSGAVDILLAHYAHTYITPGERFPRRAITTDPVDRDVRSYPHRHPDSPFTTVGDIFSAETNNDRKKPFDIRTVINAVADSDHPTLERWAAMADADTAVVVDAHLGGFPATVIGIESRPIPRHGHLPTDGPDQFTAGTLFPQSSKKVARAINAASGNRPLVVLANLSGFDGSPESLRNIQLEYGAEIGRAIVNFDGPIVFCVVSRYHGGAFVVFSGALNDNMEVVAIEGSFASVIGGAPAAAVVFTRDVNVRTAKDPRIIQLDADLASATDDAAKGALRARSDELRAAVRSEKLGEVAAEFERVHDIERARAMGSVDAIIPAGHLRPYLVGAVERGMAKTLGTPPPPHSDGPYPRQEKR